jgi:ComF family protein
MPGLGESLQHLLDAIYPPRCVVCQRPGAAVCAECLSEMHPPAVPVCTRCGATIPNAGYPAPRLCPDCASGRNVPHLDGVRVATDYAGKARTAILALKFGGQRRVAGALATLLVVPFQGDIRTVDLVIPVPLSAARLRDRGYNQAELLARALGRTQGFRVRADLLERTRATEAQSRLSREARRRNVAGAFALNSPAAGATMRGKRILLVDDVTTTGSTLDAAAEPLRAAGAATVWGLAVARPAPGASDKDAGNERPAEM